MILKGLKTGKLYTVTEYLQVTKQVEGLGPFEVSTKENNPTNKKAVKNPYYRVELKAKGLKPTTLAGKGYFTKKLKALGFEIYKKD